MPDSLVEARTDEAGRMRVAGDAKPYPEDAALFRSFLEEIGETQNSFMRILLRLGDHRPKATIVRSVQRMCSGENKISGEMRVLMTVFRNSRRRRSKAAAEAAQADIEAIAP